MLNITIRVAAAQARREINSVASEIRKAQSASGGAGMGPAASVAKRFGLTGTAAIGMASGIDKGFAAVKRFGGALPDVLSKMEKTGKNMQWVGRQLTFNFTLPLVAAGAASVKWAMDNEAAMTRVRKVYGDGTKSTKDYDKEVAALGKTFEMLSTRFGINQAAVIGIAGDWAQVGAQGRTLGEVVRATMEAMTLGEIDAADATKGLITMMAAYSLRAVPEAGQKTSELGKAIADLNAIENQTQIDMGGLIGVMQRSASSAEAAGISYQQLGAFTAALVPTAGTAAQAGNGMRTMIARLIDPTVKTTSALKNLGLVTDENAFFQMNVTDRILSIAKAYDKLDIAQKPVVDAQIAGTWQFNKFATLMKDINDPMGNYHRALQSMGLEQNRAGKSTDVMKTKQQELQRVLESNPKRFDILKVSIQNSLAKAILPLIPAIMQVMTMINGMAQAFANLSPKTQGFIIFGLAFVAIVGPIVQMMGAMILLTKELGGAAMWTGKKFGWVAKQMFSMAQNLWDFLARMILQQGTVSGAWTAGEAERVAATTAANTAIGAGTTATMAEIGAANAAAAASATTAAAITGGSWTTAAITAEAGWGMAIAEIGSGFGAIAIGSGSFGAAAAAANTAAAGTVGQVWIAANSAIVAVTTIAGDEVVTVWVGAMGAIVSAWDIMMAHMLGSLPALGMGSSAGATAVAVPWTLAAGEMTAVQTLALTEIAGAQALPALAAVPAAATTAGAWTAASATMTTAVMTPFMSLAAMMSRLGVIVMTALEGAIAGIAGVLGLPFWAVVAIIAAVAAVVVLILKTDIETPVWNVMKSIGNAIWSLPRVFVAALSALARAVARMVMTVMKWLSYLNPFQRHSPSLVDNVKAGVATILDEYSRLKAIGPMIRDAAAAHEAFNKAVKASGQDPQQRERADQRQIISEQAPSVLPSFDEMGVQVDRLQDQLPALTAEIQGQTAAVVRWEDELKSIDAALKAHQDTLAELEDQLAHVSDAMSKAQAELDRLGSTDLPGMRAMSDAIFENEQAQKRLRLEMLRMEEAGQTIEDVKQKFADLQGQIELLGGERETLRAAGAGSDILGTYDDQINALRKQQDELSETASSLDDLNKQLEELQRQGEILNLEESLNFDPQIRQIDQMIAGLHEMPFDQIVAQIGQQQAVLAALQPQYDAINAKVEAEKATVDLIQKQRDALNNSLDVEKQKLTDMESAYSDIEAQIREMTSSMTEFASAAKAAQAAAAEGMDPFDAAAGGEWEDVSGLGGLGEGGGLPDIEAMNLELQKELEDFMDDMDDMDPFKGIRDKFEGFINFIQDWGRLIAPIVIGVLLGGWPIVIGIIVGIILKWGPQIWGALQTAFGVALDVVTTVFGAVGRAIGDVWHTVIYPVLAAIGGFILDILTPVWNAFAAVVSWVWNEVISPVISAAWRVIEPIFNALWAYINNFLLPVFQLFAAIVEIAVVAIYKVIAFQIGLAIMVFKEIWGFINGNLGPIFTWLWQTIIMPAVTAIAQIITSVWNERIHPVLNAFWGFINDVLGPIFLWLWHGIMDPVMSGVSSAISASWNVIAPVFVALKTGVEQIADKFIWLKDHVIGPIWSGITAIISGAWDLIGGLMERGVNFFIDVFNKVAAGIRAVGGVIGVDVHINDMKHVDLSSTGHGSMQDPTSELPTFYEKGGYDLGRQGPFVTNGARAIVGEGNPIHPEFVIPTDPKWRQRANSLYSMLGQKLGKDVPQFAAGGIPNPINAVKGIAGGAVNVAGGIIDSATGLIRKGAVMAAFAPFLAAANHLIGAIPSKAIRDAATNMKNDAYNWAKGENDKSDAKTDAAQRAKAVTEAASAASKYAVQGIVQKNASLLGWGEGGPWKDLSSLINKESGWNPKAQNPHSSAYGLFQFLDSTWKTVGMSKTSDPQGQTLGGLKYIRNRYNTPTGAWDFHKKHGYYSSGGVLNLAQGGLIKRQAGGVLARIGEGRYDESVEDVGGKVQVLPLKSGSGSGETHNHFYGDLEFPGVKNGDDAESFIRNLESLAG